MAVLKSVVLRLLALALTAVWIVPMYLVIKYRGIPPDPWRMRAFVCFLVAYLCAPLVAVPLAKSLGARETVSWRLAALTMPMFVLPNLAFRLSLPGKPHAEAGNENTPPKA